MTQTILVVDNEIKLRDMIRMYLEKAGYRVVEASNGREAFYVAKVEKPDLILLDLMMPEMDGITFIEAFRKVSSVPVIMLTAKVEQVDKVRGLNLGADDYITKPFGVHELIARIQAVLRRIDPQEVGVNVIRMGNIVLNHTGRSVTVATKPVRLTPSEFEILYTLMSSPGRAFSRLDLLERTMGDAYEGYERTIDVHVRNLRTKIETDSSAPLYIQTVYGLGYRFSTLEEVG